MSSSSVRSRSGTSRVLWGRLGFILALLVLAFVLGRCSVPEGVAQADYDAAQARVSELEQRTRDLEQNQLALAAGGTERTPAAEAAPQATPAPQETPAEPAETPAATPEPEADPAEEGSEYTVQEGDTLEAIAERVYGDGSLFTRIQEANGVGATDLQVGQTLIIPPAESGGA